MILATKKLFITILLIGLIFFLSQVFSGRLVLSQTFSIGFVTIHYYGLIMALAILAGYFYALWSAEKFGFTKEQTENLVVWIIPICFIFARLYHVLSEWGYYQNNLPDIFKIWKGGLSIFGVIFGGVLGLIFINKILNLKSSILNLYDWLAPAVLIGQVIGRFGNLFNYEAYGLPTVLPWKMFVPLEFRLEQYRNISFYHPWFLYELVGNLIFFLLVYFYLKSKKFSSNKVKNFSDGVLFFSYILWYNALRFGLEFLRIDSVFLGNLRLNSAIALALGILGLFGLILTKRKKINV